MKHLKVLAAALALFAGTAQADFFYTGNSAYQNGTANFSFSGQNLTLTLANQTNIVDIAGMLDDFHFGIVGDTNGFTVSVVSVTAPGGSATCTKSQPGDVVTCVQNPSTNYNGTWGAFVNGSTVNMFSSQNQDHPYGIVNGTFLANASLDGLTNAQHNPVLFGPVTLVLAFNDLQMTGLTGVDFTFGTQPVHIPGTCTSGCTPPPPPPPPPLPEPGTLVLLALGLLALAAARRRKL